MQTLQPSIVEAGARITHDRLPAVSANRTQIVQVFVNLVSNALKYRNTERPLHIHIGASFGADLWTISVSDNGQGFRQEYADRIFGIFRRLHGQNVPGSGIGLAICKRLVERNGGTIWVESKEGSGSAFHFTLPAAAAEATGTAAR
jgi:signal transduction histidine kinase